MMLVLFEGDAIAKTFCWENIGAFPRGKKKQDETFQGSLA